MRLQAHIVHNFYTCENVFHAAEANQISIVVNYYLKNIYNLSVTDYVGIFSSNKRYITRTMF